MSFCNPVIQSGGHMGELEFHCETHNVSEPTTQKDDVMSEYKVSLHEFAHWVFVHKQTHGVSPGIHQ